jgi:signal transduction histidine kinase/ActR/RegA family two-component response regulator
MDNLISSVYDLFGRLFLARQAAISQMVLLFAGVVLVLLAHNIRLLRRLLNEFRQELNLSSLISRLVGAPDPQLITRGTATDFLQAVSDTIREGIQASFVLTFRFQDDTGRAAIVGASPATLITYFASDQLHQPLWKEELLHFNATSPSVRALFGGQSAVVRAPGEFLEQGPSLTFVGALCRAWRVRKCFLAALTVGGKPVGGFICGSSRTEFRRGQLTYLDRVRHLSSMLLESFYQRESQRALLEALTRKQDRLRLLNRIAQAVNANLEQSALISGSLREMEHLFPDLPVLILLGDGERNPHRIVGASSASARFLPEGVSLGFSVQLPADFGDHLASLPEHSFLRPPSSDLPAPLNILPSPIAFPIATASREFGACFVAPPSHAPFTDEDLEFFQFFTDHLALGIQNAEITRGLQNAYEQLRLSQEAMLKQENLRVLGQMASAITHDINNLLTPVFAYLELSLSDPSLSRETGNYLRTAQRAAEEIAQIVQRMREFYRDTSPERLPVHVQALVQNAVRLTEPRWRTMPQSSGVVINVGTAVEPDLPPIDGSEAQLSRALVNVIVNAVEAMPKGGTLSVRAYRSPDHPGLASGALQPSEAVIIEVSDEGVGMSAETLQRATEPFFTTKEKTGSGLGLAIARATAERHNGVLEIESEPGCGTVVRLVLPVGTTLPLADRERSVLPARAPGVRFRILVVDDEPAVLQGVSELLRKNGHTVFTAGSGEEALEIAADITRARERLDVVITDLGMPEMDGTALAKRIKTMSPSTRVVLLTGWGRAADSLASLPPEINARLEKPVHERDLLDTLAAIVSAPSS